MKIDQIGPFDENKTENQVKTQQNLRMTYDENEARTDRMIDKLQDLGLTFDPKTNSVTAAEGVEVDSLPSSIALNGAADGQGRWVRVED